MTKRQELESLVNKLKKSYPHDTFDEVVVQSRMINNLKIIGITGSNGKTSVAVLLYGYLKNMNKRCVLFSSGGIVLEGSNYNEEKEVDVPIFSYTSVIHAIDGALKTKAEYLIIEVNEKALQEGLLDEVPFDIRVITNIVPKHNTLSYTEEEYINLKKSFIENKNNSLCIFGIDSINIYNNLISSCTNYKIYSSEYIKNVFNIDNVSYLLLPYNEEFDTINGLKFKVKTENNTYSFNTNLIMPFNALNITLVIGILEELNEFDYETFQEYIQNITIPGRDEVIRYNNRTIIISLTLAPHLEILKRYQERNEINKIRLVTGMYGTGFNSWTSEYKSENYKSYVNESMKWAYNYIKKNASIIYITSNDNAKDDVITLLNIQKQELKDVNNFKLIENRKEAIKEAIIESEEGDVIFISGRGNKEVFCKSEYKIELFKDSDVVKEIIKGR